MVTLPRKIVKSESQNPRKLLIIAPPKRGKTTLVAGLNDSLLIDMEQGSSFLDAVKIEANSLDELIEVGKSIKAENEKEKKPIYKYIVLDTITKMEEYAKQLALRDYKGSAMGKNFDGDVNKFMQLPNGACYLWIRAAFERLYDFFSALTPHLILIGHLKRTSIMRDSGEIQATDLELTGRLKNITCADMDAIGMLKRKGNQSVLSFVTSEDDLVCGSRSQHLSNQEIIVAEKVDSKFIYHWDKIFIHA